MSVRLVGSFWRIGSTSYGAKQSLKSPLAYIDAGVIPMGVDWRHGESDVGPSG